MRFINEILNNNERNTFRFINEILNNKERNTLTLIHDSNFDILMGRYMTNFFNSYFINVIPEFINNHDLNVNVDSLSFISYNQSSFFFFLPATEYGVNVVITAMKFKPTNIHDIPLNVQKYISEPI